MPLHRVQLTLQQMLDCAMEIGSMVQGKTREDLDKERMLNLSLVRLLEVIGEAASRVPLEIRGQYPEIPWFEMISLRHRLIHGYDMVDFGILWNIITQDIPPLVSVLQKAIRSN
jgi:uncharacterized protein with HEPN domain